MMRHKNSGLRCLLLALAFGVPATGIADEGDPPTRIARLAYVEGQVSFQPAGTADWVAPPVNRPLTTGDQLWADRNSRAELQLDGSLLRLSGSTALSFLNLADHVTQVQLTSGTLIVQVRRLDDDETFEIDTPNLAFTVLRPGVYRLTVGLDGNTTSIGVRHGQGEATGGGTAYAVHADEYDTFSGNSPLQEDRESYGADEDAFDAWSVDRDRRWRNSVSARYVSPDVVGYEDLDADGTWSSTPDNGYVWFPRRVEPGWAPYHSGHWAYVAPWGYTWVDDQPWGFAPFHYGRWAFMGGAWGWIPARPPVQGESYVHPVYAPALVAWVGVGAGIAWFALGPREVYVPSYPVSRRYCEAINVSNTTVNTTIVNNIYNTTIVNKTVNVTQINYINRAVPGAVMATSLHAFTSAQPVARNRVNFDARAVASAPVRVMTPAQAPSHQAVLGSGPSARRPPAALQTRTVVARIAPPHAASVRVAPPARALVTPTLAPETNSRTPARPIEATRPEQPPPRAPLATAPGAHPAAPYVHAKDIPPPPRPPSPVAANSVLERQHLQEQQQLAAQQAAERQRVQQQQELEHQQRAAQESAEAERQHQQQTQELMQRHADEQRQLEARQEQQRQQQTQRPPPPPSHRPEETPKPRPR